MSTAAADEDTEPDEGPEPALNGLLDLPLTMAAPHADFFFGDHEVFIFNYKRNNEEPSNGLSSK